jgi:uncharacterized protein YfaQ (DUF2300 family)
MVAAGFSAILAMNEWDFFDVHRDEHRSGDWWFVRARQGDIHK